MADVLSPSPARALTTAALVLLCSLTGCAVPGDRSNESSAYSAEFEEARNFADTDFEREVLADSKISRMEYQEAVDRYVNCLENAGLKVSAELQASGLYQYGITYPPGTTEASPAESECAQGTTGIIEPLYGSVLMNPNNEDFLQLIVECLLRNKIVDNDYTKVDLLEELENSPVFREGDEVAAKCLFAPVE